MDDLLDWSWFRGLSLYEFAIKFYENTSRYRPTFETIQYFIYGIVGTDPTRFSIINKVYNVIIAVFIYYFSKRFNTGIIISIIVSGFYLIGHYAYYQIGQAIGPLETTGVFLSLIILYICLKLIGAFEHDRSKFCSNLPYIVLLFITFLLLVFDHERYLSTASIVFLSILFIKNSDKNSNFLKSLRYKVLLLTIFILEILLICYIRYIAIGKVLPAGTGGTYVEETFNISEFIMNCFNQVAIILGINIGPQHLYGIDFSSIESIKIKYLVYISIAVVVLIVMIYIICRVTSLKNDTREKSSISLYSDILFIVFIGTCIAASSVTIRVELRFVYISFTASLIYLSYMSGYIIRNINISFVKYLIVVLFISVFATRLPVELLYRSYYKNIYCISDLTRMNSLYDETIGKYGLDEILNNKKIYLFNQFFGLTEFYAEYFFKIYDEKNIGNKIMLINDMETFDKEILLSDNIVLCEDLMKNGYTRFE